MANRPLSPVQYIVDADTGCWLWQRGTNGKAGYGTLRVEGVRWLAHRYFYTQHRGPIPDGAELDHVVCDTPRCCNPWHVEPATHAQNLRRGRQARLTRGQVSGIKAAIARGATRAAVARQFGISRTHASQIATGKRWA